MQTNHPLKLRIDVIKICLINERNERTNGRGTEKNNMSSKSDGDIIRINESHWTLTALFA